MPSSKLIYAVASSESISISSSVIFDSSVVTMISLVIPEHLTFSVLRSFLSDLQFNSLTVIAMSETGSMAVGSWTGGAAGVGVAGELIEFG